MPTLPVGCTQHGRLQVAVRWVQLNGLWAGQIRQEGQTSECESEARMGGSAC